MNFCQQIYFENLTQNLCHKKVCLFFEIAKVYKNHASKKSKYSQGSGSNPFPSQRDMIFPLFKPPSFLKFCSSPSNTVCKLPHLLSQFPYGGCSPHVLNTCRKALPALRLYRCHYGIMTTCF